MNVARVLGYTSRLHVAPGESLGAHLHAPGDVQVSLVELAADMTRARKVPCAVDGMYAPGIPEISSGSCMTVHNRLPVPAKPRVSVSIWPTRPVAQRRQAILCWGPNTGLFIDADGHFEARWGGRSVCSERPLVERRWLHCQFELVDGSPALTLSSEEGYDCLAIPVSEAEPCENDTSGDFLMAACETSAGRLHFFDGKIARPVIYDGEQLVAKWAMGADPASTTVVDEGPDGRHGLLVNRPQKGMTGPDWRGHSTGWTEAPEEYDAVAFHDDDLVDAKWPETFRFDVPQDLPSGAYGFAIESDAGSDVLPFFVVPRQRNAPVAFLVPLFSYLAYANERHWWDSPAIEDIAGAPLEEIVGPLERWAEQQRLISVYDRHADGSGNAHSAVRRPLVNVRPDYVHPLLRGPHQLSGDMAIIEWLRLIGQPVDFVTDFCLHEKGRKALEGYSCVITGSHPEYVSEEILDALAAHIGGGGDILHMGGNSFYAVTSVYAEEGDVVEIRRGYGGTIPWQSEPGEARQAATGEPSGLWRWRGRSAHRLVGTGTSAVSFGTGSAFQRTPEAGPELDWLFDGISGPVNAAGTLSGGAAGFEVDSARHGLGTPSDTIVVAVAESLGDPAFLACEDTIATGPMAEPGCHLTWRRTNSGGEVFAASSIAWSSCLLVNGGENHIARMTGNILRRFLGPGERSNVSSNTKPKGGLNA